MLKFSRYSPIKYLRLFLTFFSLLFPLTILQGCTTASDAAFLTFRSSFQNTSSIINQSTLNSQFRYLRVNVAGLDALMVKGYIDRDSNGNIEVWYSSDGSVLRLQQGRYLGSVGFDTNWQNVTMRNAPKLEKMIADFDRPNPSPKLTTVNSFYPTEQYFFSRNHTQMPLHKTTLDEMISASVSRNTPKSIPKSLLPYLQNKSLIWIAEQQSQLDHFRSSNGLAWYGFQKVNNQYLQMIGQQCLDDNFCITWMPWPVQ